MGCDIHIIAEVKENGKWKINQDRVFLNPYYKEGNGTEMIAVDDYRKDKFQTQPDDRRNYDWFAILADVRNGRGFAGIKTGEGFDIIAEPRGVPRDASPEWKEEVIGWDSDMHSKSWLTIQDFDKFDWNQVTIKQGVITLAEYKKLRGTNECPESWCGSISGSKIVTLSEEDAGKALDMGMEPKEDVEIHVLYQWSVMYREWFKHKIETIVEPLRELTLKYGEARICFGFDN